MAGPFGGPCTVPCIPCYRRIAAVCDKVSYSYKEVRGAHFSARTGSARAPPCRRRRALPFGTASPNIPFQVNLFTHFPVHGRLFCRGGPKVHLREKVRCPARGAEKDRDRDRHGDDYRDLKV